DLIAEMIVINPFDFFLEDSANDCPFEYEPWLAKELRPFLETEPVGPRLAAFLKEFGRSRLAPRDEALPLAEREGYKMRTVDFLVAVNRRVQQEVGYTIRLEPGLQTCEQ